MSELMSDDDYETLILTAVVHYCAMDI